MKRIHILLSALAILLLLSAAAVTFIGCRSHKSDDSLADEPTSPNTNVGITDSGNTTVSSEEETTDSFDTETEGTSGDESRAVETVVPPESLIEASDRNPDVCAWITIQGTAIDFPVLQSGDDNSFYLRHDIDGNYNIDGSIFMENYNKPDFSDYMTVIYGHTMKWGTMFTPLLDYRDKTFFDKNRYINIYTKDQKLTYKIFAAYVWDTRHLLLNIDFTNRIDRSVYLQYVKTMRGINDTIADDTEVTADDKLLTLSCCTMSGDERFLVQGVLVDEQP